VISARFALLKSFDSTFEELWLSIVGEKKNSYLGTEVLMSFGPEFVGKGANDRTSAKSNGGEVDIVHDGTCSAFFLGQ